ncbi:SusD/RagB family nutrient-binding outer membrane lipoprotein [Capnocytophaga canimorsus]|uniref:SusD/RagB family nutrient-binding outer membrane lipoprotein n=1 Tax=Capnocytophaga canimorsus TaxID=28188 RepID=UPI00385F6D80
MKKSIIIASIALIVGSCTKDFEKMNQDQYGITGKELDRIPQGGNQLIDLQKLILPEQENSYQYCFDLYATGYSGYATTKFTGDYQTYNPRVSFFNYPFDDTYPKIYKAYNELKKISKGDYDKPYFALGSIYRVAITHWLTDTYGPLPYSQMKEGQSQVPYDSQKDLYLGFCEELVKSIEGLKKVDVADREYAPFDNIYKGDMQKWIKYANSLLLRISMRMSKAAPAEAKKYAEMAVAGGVITANADNAQLVTLDNPAFKTSASWGDSRVGADITEYMNAFSDPRRAKYFTEVKNRSEGKKYFGCRGGAPNIAFTIDNYSLPNLQKNSPIMIISAAEVAFLKAEGALKNWNMGGSAEELYKQGVKLSFEQWGAGDPTTYLTNSNQRGAFTDEKEAGYNDASFSSSITVNWSDATNDEQKLARIITQKWIAMFPYGSHEGWAEWRRTGYPNLLPAVENKSGGSVKTISQQNGKDTGGMRRIPFSTKEYEGSNLKNIQEAVNLLGGADNGGTDLWWAK